MLSLKRVKLLPQRTLNNEDSLRVVESPMSVTQWHSTLKMMGLILMSKEPQIH